MTFCRLVSLSALTFFALALGPGRGWAAQSTTQVSGGGGARLSVHVGDEVPAVRALYLIFDRDVSEIIFTSADWRRFMDQQSIAMINIENYPVGSTSLPEDGLGPAILQALATLGAAVNHPEIAHAPFIAWGHSRSSLWSTNMAAVAPERALGFIVWHMINTTGAGDDNRRTTAFDRVKNIPALILGGERDTTVPNANQETLEQLRQGRAGNAPWTGGLEPGLVHGNGGNDAFLITTIIHPWIASLLPKRLPAHAGPYMAPPVLRPLDASGSGWLGDLDTFAIGSMTTFEGDRSNASWAADERLACVWRNYFGRMNDDCADADPGPAGAGGAGGSAGPNAGGAGAMSSGGAAGGGGAGGVPAGGAPAPGGAGGADAGTGAGAPPAGGTSGAPGDEAGSGDDSAEDEAEMPMKGAGRGGCAFAGGSGDAPFATALVLFCVYRRRRSKRPQAVRKRNLGWNPGERA